MELISLAALAFTAQHFTPCTPSYRKGATEKEGGDGRCWFGKGSEYVVDANERCITLSAFERKIHTTL